MRHFFGLVMKISNSREVEHAFYLDYLKYNKIQVDLPPQSQLCHRRPSVTVLLSEKKIT